jgi:hypothetical protein
MIISHKYKFVFIHIHKNAGTFTTNLILNLVPDAIDIRDAYNYGHQTYKQICEMNIFDTINTNMSMSTISLTDSNSNSNSYTAIDLLPSTDTNTSINTIGGESNNSMKDELKSFLKGQLHSNDTSEIKPL